MDVRITFVTRACSRSSNHISPSDVLPRTAKLAAHRRSNLAWIFTASRIDRKQRPLNGRCRFVGDEQQADSRPKESRMETEAGSWLLWVSTQGWPLFIVVTCANALHLFVRGVWKCRRHPELRGGYRKLV